MHDFLRPTQCEYRPHFDIHTAHGQIVCSTIFLSLAEHEADSIGLRLMSKACYDPRACQSMLKKLGDKEHEVRGSVLSMSFPGTGCQYATGRTRI